MQLLGGNMSVGGSQVWEEGSGLESRSLLEGIGPEGGLEGMKLDGMQDRGGGASK